MKELIEVIAKSLVDHPSEVVVTETVSGDDLLLELKVDQIWEKSSDVRDALRKQSVRL